MSSIIQTTSPDREVDTWIEKEDCSEQETTVQEKKNQEKKNLYIDSATETAPYHRKERQRHKGKKLKARLMNPFDKIVEERKVVPESLVGQSLGVL